MEQISSLRVVNLYLENIWLWAALVSNAFKQDVNDVFRKRAKHHKHFVNEIPVSERFHLFSRMR